MEQTRCLRGFGMLAGRKHPHRKIDTVAVSAANKCPMEAVYKCL